MNMAGCCYICRVVFFPLEFYELGMPYTCPYFSKMMYIYEVAFRFPEFMHIFFVKGRKAQCRDATSETYYGIGLTTLEL